MLPINQIICGKSEDVLAGFPGDCIDLTVTSPPYDNLRTYNGYTFDFETIAQQLYRVTKRGGVVVWVVGDATVDGSETGTSFRQALRFMDIGFRLHDTMIWRKTSFPVPTQDRYYAQFEYMFVFSKGKPKTLNLLTDRINYSEGHRSPKELTIGKEKHSITNDFRITPANGRRGNIWDYHPGRSYEGMDHTAVFPEKLAEDHILSWSNPSDLVLDPFVGSGTTPKMAIRHHRKYIGIDISSGYCDLARQRISNVQTVLFDMAAI